MMKLFESFHTPIQVLTQGILLMGIVQVKEIPVALRLQFSSLLGRTFLVALTLVVGHYVSWIHGLLVALFASLVIATAPRTPTEGFQGDVDVKLAEKKRKWFVEEVLEENPIGIEEDKVRTSAIQD